MSELPSNWEKCVLSDIGTIVSGGTPSTKQSEYWGDEIPWISPSDLTGYADKFIDKGAKSLTAEGLKKSSAKLMPRGSVHFSSRAPIGYVAVSSQSLCTNQGFKSLVPAEGIFNEYVYYYLKSIKGLANSMATGTTFKELSGKAFSKLPFSFPPLNEQKRIVAKIEELFSELDAGEVSLRYAKQQLGVYRQSLLKQAFEGKLTQTWRTQNTDKIESPDVVIRNIQGEREQSFAEEISSWQKAFEEWEANGKEGKKPPKPKKHKELQSEAGEDLPTIPKDWNLFNLSHIVVALRQGWSPKCDNHPASMGKWAVMTTTAIQPLKFQAEANKTLPPHLHPRPWITLRTGDILITRAGPRSRCGVICRVDRDADKLMLCDKAYRLRFPKCEVSSEFMELLLNSSELSRKIEKLKTGINDSGVNITQDGFLKLSIPLPSLAEQKEIVRLLDVQFEVIEQNEREIDAALRCSEALRQSILKKAFTGQLVPQDPTDEPASPLLTRIQAQCDAESPRRKARKGNTRSASLRRTKKGGKESTTCMQSELPL